MNTQLNSARQLSGAEAPSSTGYRGSELAADLLTRLFRRFPGCLTLRLWNGATLRVGANAALGPDSSFTLVFHHPAVVCSAVLGRDPLALAEAYFRGDLDIEGDFFAALGLKDHLQALRLSPAAQLRAAVAALRLRIWNARTSRPQSSWAPSHGHSVKAHSKAENRDAIHFHYDVSNEFYSLWLDRAMVYSCAYFETPGADLDAAQHAKLDHICRKLALRPGEKFLDIGCGWGALVIHAAQHYGVRAHGVTLSPQQLKVARERISQAGLERPSQRRVAGLPRPASGQALRQGCQRGHVRTCRTEESAAVFFDRASATQAARLIFESRHYA